ncbi:hypothetical protein J2126_004401 [Xanthobacter flavus]|nr:hypothetical protein [Xanthobacter flavus]
MRAGDLCRKEGFSEATLSEFKARWGNVDLRDGKAAPRLKRRTGG